MVVRAVLVLGWTRAASAEEPPEPAADDGESPYALSVGTGPRPLNTLTLGLTGLGARLMFPSHATTFPWVGLSANSFSGSDFDPGLRSRRRVSGASAVHVSGGIRHDFTERKARAVVPYLTVGGLAGYGGTRGGTPAGDDWYKVGTSTVAVLAGFGFDGFLTPHLSLGAELGGMGAYSEGSSRDVENGNVDNRYSKTVTTVLTSFTSAQITVWR